MSLLCNCVFTVLFTRSGVKINHASGVIAGLRDGGLYLLPDQQLLTLSSHHALKIGFRKQILTS